MSKHSVYTLQISISIHKLNGTRCLFTRYQSFKGKKQTPFFYATRTFRDPGYSVVDIATGYGLDDRKSEFQSQYGQEFPLLQIGNGVHPTSDPLGTGGSFPGVKRPGREADHSLPARAAVKKTWIYTSTRP
jgi:hypothetical protein